MVYFQYLTSFIRLTKLDFIPLVAQLAGMFLLSQKKLLCIGIKQLVQFDVVLSFDDSFTLPFPLDINLDSALIC